MADNDWVHRMFPGPGDELPTDQERDAADKVVAEWAAKWGEPGRTIARERTVQVSQWATGGRQDTPCTVPTNRAYMRAQLRRWWYHREPVGATDA